MAANTPQIRKAKIAAANMTKVNEVENTLPSYPALEADLTSDIDIAESIFMPSNRLNTVSTSQGHSVDAKSKVLFIKFEPKISELWFSDYKVKIKRNTNQSLLCNILLTSKAKIHKEWEIEDVVRALGEHTETKKDMDRFIGVIYNTIRHLNVKIQNKTGIKEFLLYESKTVMVNPKYR